MAVPPPDPAAPHRAERAALGPHARDAVWRVLPCGAHGLRGTVRVPGDKSVSHRAVLFAALCTGTTTVRGALQTGDVAASLAAASALGVHVERAGDRGPVTLTSPGVSGWTAPAEPVDCAGSGTTMRLLAGLLAPQPFASTLTGNAQLRARPMARIANPLGAMGAQVHTTDGTAPIRVQPSGARLQGTVHKNRVASAQVKSAQLLAGLFAAGPTTVEEPALSRDHTERWLVGQGIDLRTTVHPDGRAVHVLTPPAAGPAFVARDVDVPGDPSSAAFWLAAGSLAASADGVLLPGVLLNPTRTGFMRAAQAMGARFDVSDVRQSAATGGEPVGDVRVHRAALHAITVGAADVPAMIDELPLLALLATQAEGTTRITGAADLRTKESDRIAATTALLTTLGARIDEQPDGWHIHGPTPLRAGRVPTADDHRLAMLGAVAGLIAAGPVCVEHAGAADDSYPGFWADLAALGGQAGPAPLALGLVGQGVGYSLSPVLHEAALAAAGLPGAYRVIDVAPAGLEGALREAHAAGAHGLNVTVPHKEAAAALCTSLSDAARVLGAVNTLVRTPRGWHGDNTDVPGFAHALGPALDAAGVARTAGAPWHAVVLGSGGAARAVCFALMTLPERAGENGLGENGRGENGLGESRTRPASLTVVARRAGRAHAMLDTLRDALRVARDTRAAAAALPSLHVLEWHDAHKAPRAAVWVQATPLGGAHAPGGCPPLPPRTAGADAPAGPMVAYDLVYAPPRTPWLRTAAARGAHVYNGLDMLVGQAAHAFALWTGTSAQAARTAMAKAARGGARPTDTARDGAPEETP